MDLHIDHLPVAGSPRRAYYVIDLHDEEFEDGPHQTIAAAEDARTALLEDASVRTEGDEP